MRIFQLGLLFLCFCLYTVDAVDAKGKLKKRATVHPFGSYENPVRTPDQLRNWCVTHPVSIPALGGSNEPEDNIDFFNPITTDALSAKIRAAYAIAWRDQKGRNDASLESFTFFWRCWNGAVLACNSATPSNYPPDTYRCDSWANNAWKSGDLDFHGLAKWCNDHPNERDILPRANPWYNVHGIYRWNCKGRAPQLGEAKYEADRLNYLVEDWVDVTGRI